MDYEILNCEELAKRLNVTESWVREMTRRRTTNQIPHLKFGKYRRFAWGSPELDDWIAAQRRGGRRQ